MTNSPRVSQSSSKRHFPCFDELPDKSKDGGKLVFRITQEDKLDTIWRALGYDRRAHFALHLNFALLEEECCRASFLRGRFCPAAA